MPKIKSVKALYNSQAWIKSSKTFLRNNPLCKFHQQRNLIAEAAVVDHIQPHRGDSKLFWDKTNWQSLCKHCHDSHKQRLEKSGRVAGCDSNGIPIDPGHHWAGAH
ncbi:MAG TPA: HNH endonuclease [Cellvibrionaceae bacterium]